MPEFEWREGVASTIAVNGQTLEAVCYGPSPDEAPTIVLLHEGLGCLALWRDFPKKLAEATGFGGLRVVPWRLRAIRSGRSAAAARLHDS